MTIPVFLALHDRDYEFDAVEPDFYEPLSLAQIGDHVQLKESMWAAWSDDDRPKHVKPGTYTVQAREITCYKTKTGDIRSQLVLYLHLV